MNKRFSKHAFTLVEMLVVVTLLSILSLTVYATFASGMRLWQRIQDSGLSSNKTVLGLEKFTSQMRQALDFPKIGCAGKSNAVAFGFLSDTEILKITYFLEEKSLFRKEESFKDILAEKEQAKARKLISDIEDLKFSFAYPEEGKDQYSWKDTWNKEEGMPAIVKIELKTKDANFVKTVIIPTS